VPLADPKRPPLATSSPYPQSNNLFDVYFKRSFGGLSFGGEGAWLSGSAIDFNNNGVEDSLNAFGVMLNVSYETQKIKGFLDFLYASGDTAINSDRLNGFVLLHRNRRPGLILGRELLGNYANSSVGQGSLVYYGQNSGATTSSFSGAYYFRPGVRFEWSPSWASGIELIIAQKAATSNGESGNLGVEVDFGTDHEFYKNFDIGLNVGYLFPGQGLGVTSPEGVFAFRTTAVVKF
jgi:hypothetical protein